MSQAGVVEGGAGGDQTRRVEEAQVHGGFRVRPLAVCAGEHQVAHPRLGGDIPFRIEHRGWNLVIEITRISRQRQPNLPQVVGATGSLRLVLSLAERWEQQSGEDGNNGNDHQQLDQGERPIGLKIGFHRERKR